MRVRNSKRWWARHSDSGAAVYRLSTFSWIPVSGRGTEDEVSSMPDSYPERDPNASATALDEASTWVSPHRLKCECVSGCPIRLVLEIPEAFGMNTFLAAVSRVHLEVAGLSLSSPPAYSFEGGRFLLRRGPRHIDITHVSSFPISLVAVFERGGHRDERRLVDIEFPGEPVALCLAVDTPTLPAGTFVESAPAGAAVALLGRPGCIPMVYPGFTPFALGRLRGLLGIVPPKPSLVSLIVDGQRDRWPLAAPFRRPPLRIEGAPLRGFHFGARPVLSRPPRIHVPMGTARLRRVTLAGTGAHPAEPDSEPGFERADCAGTIPLRRSRTDPLRASPAPEAGTDEKTVTLGAGGRAFVSPALDPGAYDVEVDRGDGFQLAYRFIIIPDEHFPVLCSTPAGTRVACRGALLRRLDGAETGRGCLNLPSEVRGLVRIGVSFLDRPLAKLGEGVWRTVACPGGAHLRDGDAVPAVPAGDADRDVAGAARRRGLEIVGPPGSLARVRAPGLDWTLFIGGDGLRWIPFQAFPWRVGRPLRLEVSGEGFTTCLGPYIDPRARRPRVRLLRRTGGRSLIQVSLPDYSWERAGGRHGLFLEMLPAEAIESAPVREEVRLVDDSGTLWAEARAPARAGDYIVAVMEGARRLSGMTFVRIESRRGRADADARRRGPEKVSDTRDDRRTAGEARLGDEGEGWTPPPSRSKVERRAAMRAVGTRLKAGLEREGEVFLERLAAPMLRHGPEWFYERECLREVAGLYRLKAICGALARPALVLELFRAASIPWYALRYGDFFALAPFISPLSPSEIAMLLRELDEKRSGLLLPAWQAWSAVLGGEDAGGGAPLPGPWRECGRVPIEEPGVALLDRLRAPDEECSRTRMDLSPRFLGLIEARLQSGRRPYSYLSAEVRRTSTRIAGWRARGWIPDRHHRLPGAVNEIELIVCVATYRLHQWRRGRTCPPVFWDEMDQLWRDLPILCDYWLNRWALLARADADGDEGA